MVIWSQVIPIQIQWLNKHKCCGLEEMVATILKVI